MLLGAPFAPPHHGQEQHLQQEPPFLGPDPTTRVVIKVRPYTHTSIHTHYSHLTIPNTQPQRPLPLPPLTDDPPLLAPPHAPRRDRPR